MAGIKLPLPLVLAYSPPRWWVGFGRVFSQPLGGQIASARSFRSFVP